MFVMFRCRKFTALICLFVCLWARPERQCSWSTHSFIVQEPRRFYTWHLRRGNGHIHIGSGSQYIVRFAWPYSSASPQTHCIFFGYSFHPFRYSFRVVVGANRMRCCVCELLRANGELYNILWMCPHSIPSSCETHRDGKKEVWKTISENVCVDEGLLKIVFSSNSAIISCLFHFPYASEQQNCSLTDKHNYFQYLRMPKETRAISVWFFRPSNKHIQHQRRLNLDDCRNCC